MLPRKNRLQLRQQPDFFSTARRVRSRFLIWYYQPITSSQPQCAVIVPKKKISQTVKRNFLKRQLHDLLFAQLNQLSHRAVVVYWNTSRIPERTQLEHDVKVGLAQLT